MLAKMTSKNQITLPKAILQKLGGAEYFDVTLKDQEIVLKPVVVTSPGERLKKTRAKIKALGLTENSVHDAIRWARGRNG